MEQLISMAHGGSAEAEGDMSDMLPIKKSRKKGLKDIDLKTRLRILQQAAFDYQGAGGEIAMLAYKDEHGKPIAVIVLGCVAIDEHGNFKPNPHGSN